MSSLTVNVAVPHFAFPFEPNGNAFAVREQDTSEEIQDCVLVLLLTPKGSRMVLPSYGTPEILFSQMPPNIPEIISECNQWEPRAIIDLEATLDTIDQTVVTITAAITGGSS
jgi:phage baseplate assembly protein W